MYFSYNIVDVLLLLTPDHPAVTCLKLLFLRLPRFSLNTPLPYNPIHIPQLHKQNINSAISNLCYYNLPLPHELDNMIYHPNCLPPILSNSRAIQPFNRLKRVLFVFDLMILPADKTNQIVIAPKSTVMNEMNIHLSDTETYRIIEEEEHCV